MNAVVPIPSWAMPTDNDPLPHGEYLAVVIDSEARMANGASLVSPRYQKGVIVITYMIVEGDYTGRKIEEQFHINDASLTVRDVECGRFASLVEALGMVRVGLSSRELHGKHLKLSVFTQGRTVIVLNHLRVRIEQRHWDVDWVDPSNDA
ncbi:hypothetical protein EJ069_10390 [Mesorhizobium sp. M2A.F.Ca.ET.043.05.1.1]|uniref:DUF669 domain-containing protein n=1 Tax=Mesorhizobium sp. M2A.F.Ca.ET.043.05.1.1 TaxID=2493671 RepID=UPI000F7505E6|nr:DUF669 domain-containing protein [Mesorhizobium sp. M2A.F.Ca.ET.043.05.1.1]AZO15103.1 hypothetical protein EJ069_10390 [Mesorhizobium sp. M2A.F.Ca.ET.043.05.1.1]